MNGTAALPRSRAALLCGAAAAVIAAIALAASLRGGFVYDDHRFVADNAALREPSILWRAFADPSCQTSDGTHAGLWRPLRTLSFAFDAAVLGGSPGAMHAVQVLLHAAGTFLVASLLLAWRAPPLAAALGALVYGLHPAQAECVAWISSRGDLLAAALVWGALLADVGGRKRTAVVLGCAALLAKEQAVVWPLLVPLSRAAAGRPWREGFRAARAPLVATACFVAVRHLLLTEPTQEGGLGIEVGAREVAASLGHQTWFGLTGTGSLFDWQMPPGALPPLVLAAAALPFAALANRGTRIAAAWWLAALVPTLFAQVLVPLNILVADRFVLFGLPALSLAAARGVSGSRLRAAVLGAGLAGLLLSTRELVPVWTSDASLWGRTAARVPDHYRANAWLGADLLRRGDAEAAIPRLAAATKHPGADGRTWYHLAVALESRGFASGDSALVTDAARCYGRAVAEFAKPRAEAPATAVVAAFARAELLLVLREPSAADAIDRAVAVPVPALAAGLADALRERARRVSDALRSSGDLRRADAVRSWAGIR